MKLKKKGKNIWKKSTDSVCCYSFGGGSRVLL